jgi:alkylation response protein AidB-like acyl-CoA dehydrogenase
MDFDFSDEQEQLRDAVRKWVDKAYDFERRRAIVAAGGFDRAAYGEMAELGLTGLFVSEAHGGMGMGPNEAMVTLEELGRGIVLEPLAQTLIASATLQTHAPTALQAAWLSRMAEGTALVVLAHQERGARYQLQRCTTQATQSGGQWTLTGNKSLVAAGDQADAFIVPAMVNGSGGQASPEMGLFLVERNASGVRTQAYGTQDGSRAAEVAMNAAPGQLITLNGLSALEEAVDIGMACACAEAVGVMDKTLAITVEYMNTRKQFGVNIASFQALRHRVADMKMQLELGRSMSYYATLKLHAPAPERRRALARAKYQLGTSMRFIGQQAVQLHGGIAVTDEYIVSHYFKKLTQLDMTFGDTLHQLGEVSARMQDTAGVFA